MLCPLEVFNETLLCTNWYTAISKTICTMALPHEYYSASLNTGNDFSRCKFPDNSSVRHLAANRGMATIGIIDQHHQLAYA